MVKTALHAFAHLVGGRLRRSRAALGGLIVVAGFLFVACSGGSGTSADAKAEEDDGDLAPDFELTLFETPNHARGETISLSQFRGQPVVLNFWFPSCPPCVAEMPDLEAAFQAHKEIGLQFIGIQLLGLDTANDGQEFVNEVGVTYALGADETGAIVRNYKITGFPSTVLIDEDQRLIRTWTGLLDASTLDGLIEDLLN